MYIHTHAQAYTCTRTRFSMLARGHACVRLLPIGSQALMAPHRSIPEQDLILQFIGVRKARAAIFSALFSQRGRQGVEAVSVIGKSKPAVGS